VDLAARYGGEEFVVILPETSASGALIVAERLRSQVAAMVAVKRQVTVSVGVSSTEGQDKSLSPSLLLRLADEAMYEAKASGRNAIRSKVPLPAESA
jgi:two-component system cell cycle response regulator